MNQKEIDIKIQKDILKIVGSVEDVAIKSDKVYANLKGKYPAEDIERNILYLFCGENIDEIPMSNMFSARIWSALLIVQAVKQYYKLFLIVIIGVTAFSFLILWIDKIY
ncbi:hypothetical protein COU74_02565 [Candidatus Peregrinibacteria bacterium CG10_big_fil_rev_8_21_14_0_10_36_19]|nr:MAG: hypothetical protein COU74_02565 [Candidatus Peregrinibacteria bacterium CG10_big_fil_rev_8_21_14_0_10_36_19]